jgi:hypothetical protein
MEAKYRVTVLVQELRRRNDITTMAAIHMNMFDFLMTTPPCMDFAL